ncbi:hypothetical protein EUGRSUZ_A00816 [Eucalyptus grandis]|uniref:Uncharacterized protein n=2 Tax=Eucalyptus grandis TaxID=71139 RepID=A0ACC3M0M8_EUCGR|nr:hypothetical protein EUGRSUZ_A00816 [Eucalyptus grandis]
MSLTLVLQSEVVHFQKASSFVYQNRARRIESQFSRARNWTERSNETGGGMLSLSLPRPTHPWGIVWVKPLQECPDQQSPPSRCLDQWTIRSSYLSLISLTLHASEARAIRVCENLKDPRFVHA